MSVEAGLSSPDVLRRCSVEGGPQLRQVRVTRPTADAIETVAIIACGEMTWAMAFRLELVDGAWRCTMFQVV